MTFNFLLGGFMRRDEKPKRIYEPKLDITAYELALLLPYVFPSPLSKDDFEALPPEVRRHIVEE